MFLSSPMVERGFSTVNGILTDNCLRLSTNALNNLMVIHINCPVLTALDPNHEQKLVRKAVTKYMSNTSYTSAKKE